MTSRVGRECPEQYEDWYWILHLKALELGLYSHIVRNRIEVLLTHQSLFIDASLSLAETSNSTISFRIHLLPGNSIDSPEYDKEWWLNHELPAHRLT